MKKNILCFLFLFISVFYAQATDITQCAGDNNFDLTWQKTDLIGNLDPAETTVSYHLSLEDATNNTNAIANPSNYHVTAAYTTIYARIDNKGTITTNSFNIRVIPPLNITIENTAIICKGYTSTLTVTASGGVGQLIYSLNGGSPTASNIFANLSAGIHTIQVLDAVTGCSTTITHTLTEPINSLYTTATINGQTAAITAIGGTAPYQYASNSTNYQPSNVFPNLAPGNNTFFTRDSQGCIATVTANVFPILTSVVSITKPLDCISNASATITAIGGQPPYFYSLNGGTYQASSVFNNLTAGTHVITVKDATNSSVSTNTITITPLTNLTAVATIAKALNCGESDTVTITAIEGKAPFVYSLDHSNNYSSANTFTGLTAGTHIFYVKDANNCVMTLYVTIEPSTLLTISSTTKNPTCSQTKNGEIILTASGGKAPYTYSIGNGYVTNNTFNLLSAGNYNLSVKDALGCISTINATIIDPTPLSLTAVTTNSTTGADNDGTVTINATGGIAPYSYALKNNDGLTIIPFQTSTIFTGLKAGSYDVQVIDTNGCTYLQGITILNNTNSLAITTSITPTTCTNPHGTITINATGGTAPYEYSLDDGIHYVLTNVFTALAPGTYSIKVRDVYTVTSITTELTPANPPAVTATLISNVICKGDNTGSIVVNTTGGLIPYMYSLDNEPYINGENNMTFNNLHAGTHQITVKDANGCPTTTQVVVSEPVSALTTEAIIKNQTITINVSGGSGTYKYAISPDLDKFMVNNVFSELNPDSYTILISDENGCYNTINVLVDPSAPTIDGQINLTLPFKPGQTLANLIINGKNIKWYSSQHPLTGKTKKTAETPLPITTVLVDGTTYYASQTINGIESTERLAVTVKSGALGTDDFVIKDFTYYPNPVKNVLTISNTSVIDEAIVTSTNGATLLTKKINSLRSEIDLANFSKGVYFLKIKSEGTEKTVKLIKE